MLALEVLGWTFFFFFCSWFSYYDCFEKHAHVKEVIKHDYAPKDVNCNFQSVRLFIFNVTIAWLDTKQPAWCRTLRSLSFCFLSFLYSIDEITFLRRSLALEVLVRTRRCTKSMELQILMLLKLLQKQVLSLTFSPPFFTPFCWSRG